MINMVNFKKTGRFYPVFLSFPYVLCICKQLLRI